MLIRCEKCNTLYELDEKLLPPTGAPVQCSKCQFVFKAYPNAREDVPPANEASAAKDEGPPAPATTIEPADADGDEAADASPTTPVTPATPVVTNAASTAARRGGPATAAEASAAKGQGTAAKKPPPPPPPDEPQFTADGRPIRKVPFPTEEPAPMGARPPMGRVPGRASSAAKGRRWAVVVVPLVVVLVLVAAFVAWRMLSRQQPAAQRAEGHSLLLRGAPPARCWSLPPAAPAHAGRASRS